MFLKTTVSFVDTTTGAGAFAGMWISPKIGVEKRINAAKTMGCITLTKAVLFLVIMQIKRLERAFCSLHKIVRLF
jgi:hypothetical protein